MRTLPRMGRRTRPLAHRSRKERLGRSRPTHADDPMVRTRLGNHPIGVMRVALIRATLAPPH